MVGGDLGEAGAVALALRRGAGQEPHLARRQHADGGALERPKPGALDIGPDADADEAAFRARLFLPRAEIAIVRLRDRLLEHGRIIAAVVGEGPAVAKNEADGIRHLLGPDEIAAAQLGGVESRFARGLVHEPLHREGRLRAAGAAHRRGPRLVGEGDGHLEMIGREGRKGPARWSR